MKAEKKTVALGEVFTDAEIERAAALYNCCKPGGFCDAVVREVITPEVLARIDAHLGQKNNARYWGYALEHALMQSQRKNA